MGKIYGSREMRPLSRGGAIMTLIVVLLCGFGLHGVEAQTSGQPRFTVELKSVDADDLPALQSFSLAKGSDGKWLIVGGRTNGLHPFVQSSNNGTTPPPNAFPIANANRRIWVIDPAARRAWSATLDGLPTQIADALSATNAQSRQEGNVLYIIGGYGWDSQKQQMTTFGLLNAIQVDETIKAVMNNSTLVNLIQQTGTYLDCPQFGVNAYNACDTDPKTGEGSCKPGPGWADCVKKVQARCRTQRQQAVGACVSCVQNGQTQCAWNGQTSAIPTVTGYYTKVTGGGLERVGNIFYLVFGQQFEGLYSILEGDYGKWPISQTYAEQVVALHFTQNPLAAAVLNVYQQDPNDLSAPYHRRDLNVLPALAPDGTTARIVAHGGVFVPGQDSAYRQPVFIDNGSNPMSVKITVDQYEQVMSQYECAVLQMFDRSGGSAGRMINVFFGGISLYYLDAKTGKLKIDSGLPFINSITSLTYNPDGSWSEYIRRAPMSGLMGSETKFVPLASVSAAGNGIIYLDAIQGNTMVGYLYGGILASQSKAQDASDAGSKYTQASNALYEVWVSPAAPPQGYWVSTTSAATGTATGGKVSGTNLRPGSNVLKETLSKPSVPAQPAPKPKPKSKRQPKKSGT